MLLRRTAAILAAGLLVACTGGSGDEQPSATPTASTTVSAAACTDGEDLDPGVSNQTMDVDGGERGFVVYAPPSYDGTSRLPVVYLVHGLGGQAEDNLAYSGFATVAEVQDFMVVAPQAVGPDRRWDFRTPASEEGSDAAFLRDLMDETVSRWCVEPDRQYAAGVSNGSAMIFAMACSGDYPVQAYGGVAATFYEPSRCDDAPPASIVYFHGTADAIVPFQGGPTPIEPVRPTPETLAAWAEHGGCRATPSTDDVADDVEQQDWQDCDDDARLEAYIVEEGGHTWPGAFPIPTLGKTATSISATAIMADFFDLGD